MIHAKRNYIIFGIAAVFSLFLMPRISFGALALDASTPLRATVTATSTQATIVTSPSFTPPSGSIIVVAAESDVEGSAGSFSGPTDNLGTHLTYHLVLNEGNTTSNVYSGLWWAYVTSSAAMKISVTQNEEGSLSVLMLSPLVFTGANTSTPIGANGGGKGLTTNVSDAATSTITGSWFWLTYGDWNAAAVPTPGGAQTLYASTTVSGQDTYAIIKQNAVSTSTNESITMKTTAPTSGVTITHIYFEVVPSSTPAAPDATSISTTVNGDGARSGDSITITGTNFGTVATSSRATCNGAAGTGCIKFIVGGTDTVVTSSITNWTNTSITFTVSSTLASNGGASAVQVWAANASDTTPLTFYVYPNIKSLSTVGYSGLPAARTYNASDTDGLVMLGGDHFGAAGTSSILGVLATQFGSASGPCSVGGYTTTSACFEVSSTISSTTYSGNVILTRTLDNKQASSTVNLGANALTILPRITSVNPSSTYGGQVVQILGDHFCPTGTCPVSPNRSSTSNNILFLNTTSSDSDFVNLTGGGGTCNGAGAAWTKTEICVDAPGNAPTGSASTTVTANGEPSNLGTFTITAPPTPGTPGTPTYSSIASSSAAISWTGSTGVVSYYKIERATSTQVFLQVTTSSATSTTDSTLSANTTYYYRVRATNAGGDGSYSASSSVLTLPDIPSTPTYTSINSSTLTVNWNAPTGGAASYVLQRSTSSEVYAQVATPSNTSSSDSSLVGNTNYNYKVRSVNATGNSAFSATSTVLTLPAAPGTPTFSSVSTTIITVSWTTPTGGASYYKIERAPDSGGSPGSFAQIATSSGSSYGDTGLTASTTYWYRIRGTNATGDGAYGGNANTSTLAAPVNNPPNAPTETAPATNSQDISVTPTFTISATDPTSDNLEYRVVLYTNSGCTATSTIYDETSSQTGWSGQNASSSQEYSSGSTATYMVQSGLSANTTYYWASNAIDPEGSNKWGAVGSCMNLTTSFGNWTTDSGSWSISGGRLTVTPASGSSVQIHVTGQSQTNGVIEFQGKASSVGANTGNIAGIVRADSGANRYQLTMGDFLNQQEAIGKRVTSLYTALSTNSFTFTANTFAEFRGSISGTTLKSWVNGGTALAPGADSALSSAGFIGLAASSTNGSAAFTFEDFAFYNSTVITMNNLPVGGSWAILDRTGTKITISGVSCWTGSSVDLSLYAGQVPIDYDNGGAQIAVWSGNSTCNSTPSVTYPSSGLATDIFGGDTYAYNASGGGTVLINGSTPTATSTISISPTGLVSY